jgi:hypothetical protein
MGEVVQAALAAFFPFSRAACHQGAVMLGSLPCDGWFYKIDGQNFGPLSLTQVQEMLVVGHLQPQQVVCNRAQERLLFLRAEAFRPGLQLAAAG